VFIDDTGRHLMGNDEEIRAVRARMTMRDNDRLREDLKLIGEVGWEHPSATALLQFVREDLVRPLVIGEGLRGLAAWQAEASGWAVAWEMLRDPALRHARSPWGIVWAAVRREVRAEAVSARYCTGLRRAWHARGPSGASPTPSVLSLDRLAELGVEPEAVQGSAVGERWGAGSVGGVLEVVVGAMCDAGWHAPTAIELVESIAELARCDVSDSRRKAGWRTLADQLGLPPWQVRRVMVVLLGEAGWEGVLARVRREGPDVLVEVGVIAALRSTVVEWMRPPRRVAALAVERDSARRQRRVS
jgi:hypothetical protein